VTENPYILALDIAEFERELSYVSTWNCFTALYCYVTCFQSFLTDTELRNVSALYNPMSLDNFTDLFPDVSFCFQMYFCLCIIYALYADWLGGLL